MTETSCNPGPPGNFNGHVINFAQDDFENDVLPILDADGHMTNCTKNDLQKESNYDCRAYPSTVGHVINFAQVCFENDVLPIVDADCHMTQQYQE